MVLISKNKKNGSEGVLFLLSIGYWLPTWLKMTLFHGCFWFILQLKYIVIVPNKSINCWLWVLEMTLLKLTQYYSYIFLTTYLLTNPLFIHSGQYLLFLTTRWKSRLITLLLFISCFDKPNHLRDKKKKKWGIV